MLINDEEGNVMNIADDADRLQTLLYSAYDSDTVRETMAATACTSARN